MNMVAIGLEHLGEQEFVDGGFFDGGERAVCVCTNARTHACICGCVFS